MIAAMLALSTALTGCLGHTAVDNELVGQVKKVKAITPLLCPDYKIADISLGVIRNGTGSMSKEDVWVYVASDTDYKALASAAGSGQVVKVVYSTRRAGFCTGEVLDDVTHVELVN